ncbi:MAG: ComEC/Rec2 family competence protein, partial [Rhizomicrobium sp.]
VTSFVGSIATIPYAIFHFDRATHYAVLGNLLAMPVMGLVVMPSAALSVAAMPLGLDHWPLQALSWGISLMVGVGRFVSGLPGAVTMTPAFPLASLVVIALGGLWLLIWQRRWRWWGIVPMILGAFLAVHAPKPDLMVGADARTIALRNTDGRFYFPFPPKDRYAAGRWLIRDGDGRSWRDAVDPSLVTCDALGCVARQHGLTLALTERPEALDEDCLHADLVVSAAPVSACSGPRLVLDSHALAKGGGYAIMFAPLRARSVNEVRGKRPWVAQ